MSERKARRRVVRDVIPQSAGWLGLFITLRYVGGRLFGSTGELPLSGGLQIVVALIAVLGLGLLLLSVVLVPLLTRTSVETMQIRSGASDGWPPASFAMQNRFSDMGFEQFGSIEVGLPHHDAVFAGMLSPDGTTMGIVTPAHLVFMTDFGGKLLSTTNQPAGAAMRYALRQHERYAEPEALWALHASGIAALAEYGLVATVYDASSAMDAFLAIERHSTSQFKLTDEMKAAAAGYSFRRSPSSLANDSQADRRIRRWLDAPDRWNSGAFDH